MNFKLAILAKRVFYTLANSMPSKRFFSITKFLYSKVCNQLILKRANYIAFIFLNTNALERLGNLKDSNNRKERLDSQQSIDPAELLKIEDKHQNLFKGPKAEEFFNAVIDKVGEEDEE